MTTVLLDVNGIEVIYNHVILVLKGVSLRVPEGGVVALLGGNGAGKTTTLRAVSNLLAGERGEVTKGSIELRGERIEKLTTSDMVRRGVVQVMEGRHCFAHLTIEENLLTGAYTRRDGKAAVAATLDKVYAYFPRLKTRRTSQAAYTSGGEQQMCAIGRALMASPSIVLLDEPSMGLAPQIVEEVFEIVRDLNAQGRRDLPPRRAEHQHGAALRRLRLHPRETAASSWTARRRCCARTRTCSEFYLGTGGSGSIAAANARTYRAVKSYKRRKDAGSPEARRSTRWPCADADALRQPAARAARARPRDQGREGNPAPARSTCAAMPSSTSTTRAACSTPTCRSPAARASTASRWRRRRNSRQDWRATGPSGSRRR